MKIYFMIIRAHLIWFMVLFLAFIHLCRLFLLLFRCLLFSIFRGFASALGLSRFLVCGIGICLVVFSAISLWRMFDFMILSIQLIFFRLLHSLQVSLFFLTFFDSPKTQDPIFVLNKLRFWVHLLTFLDLRE